MQNYFVENKGKDIESFITDYLSPRPHFHKHIEIIYVINGHANAFADNRQTVINTGELFVAFPNQIHYYEHSSKGQYIVAVFLPELVYGLENLLLDNIPKSNALPKKAIGGCENLLLEYAEADGEFADSKRVGLMNLFLAQILPKYSLIPRVKTGNTTLQSVLNYCSENFAEDLTLDIVADALHISKFHISHLLNKKLEMSFSDYINNIRINKACFLLKNNDLKISDISEEVGFGSIRSFNRAFKQVMNMTPQSYRIQT